MTDSKTVGGSIISSDPLIAKQREDVAKMRASLLFCGTDSTTAMQAMKNITVLRIYHQISRIIRYLEMMDKIEEKLYQSIDCQLDKLDADGPLTWMTLLNIQERLQKNLIESHKILQPYLKIEEFTYTDLQPISTSDGDVSPAQILSQESRDKIRTSAQQVLSLLDTSERGNTEVTDD